jgi:hypothetical protein
MRFWSALSWTESQGACSIDHSFIVSSSQHLVLESKWSTIKSIVNIGEEATVWKRR